jgi:protein-S-isoprenylcysteine O-methyltransferase Ste14
MRLLDHFTSAGDRLFRWRSYLPLLLLPVFALGLLDASLRVPPLAYPRVWQIGCFLLAAAGLAIRIVTIGTAPPGTSERSTTSPRASSLNTTGIYSVIRHPLYLGNTLGVVGLACLPGVWYLPVIVALASLLYHERIAAREEQFLEEQFGDEFRRWADAVPAMVPAVARYRPGVKRFTWREVLRREFHGLLDLGVSFFVVDLARRSLAAGRLTLDPLWTTVFLATAVVFVVLMVVKKATNLLKTW